MLSEVNLVNVVYSSYIGIFEEKEARQLHLVPLLALIEISHMAILLNSYCKVISQESASVPFKSDRMRAHDG